MVNNDFQSLTADTNSPTSKRQYHQSLDNKYFI